MSPRGGAAARAGSGFLVTMAGRLFRATKSTALLRGKQNKPGPWSARDPRFEYRSDGRLVPGQQNIDAAIEKYGIRVEKGTPVRLDRSKRGLHGETLIKGGRPRIELTPDAFVNEEQLSRTIYHENVHVRQLLENGRRWPSGAKEVQAWEKEAWETEENWWNNLTL